MERVLLYNDQNTKFTVTVQLTLKAAISPDMPFAQRAAGGAHPENASVAAARRALSAIESIATEPATLERSTSRRARTQLDRRRSQSASHPLPRGSPSTALSLD